MFMSKKRVLAGCGMMLGMMPWAAKAGISIDYTLSGSYSESFGQGNVPASGTFSISFSNPVLFDGTTVNTITSLDTTGAPFDITAGQTFDFGINGSTHDDELFINEDSGGTSFNAHFPIYNGTGTVNATSAGLQYLPSTSPLVFGVYTLSNVQFSEVPEPASLSLFGGVAVLLAARRRRTSRA